jgi:hypothetical protein
VTSPESRADLIEGNAAFGVERTSAAVRIN